MGRNRDVWMQLSLGPYLRDVWMDILRLGLLGPKNIVQNIV
jgi:hypothetical protein